MSPITTEDQARNNIDTLLEKAGWQVFDVDKANIMAARGVAIREFPLNTSHSPRARGEGGVEGRSYADYLLYIDGKAAGVIEAKKERVTLTGVEIQSDKYTKGLPAGLPRWDNPLPFAYQSTGVETRFTNGLDSEPSSHPVFAFHRPETLAAWLEAAPAKTPSHIQGLDLDENAACKFIQAKTPSPFQGEGWDGGSTRIAAEQLSRPMTFLHRMRYMPPLKTEGLWPAQIKAIHNLEQSLKENRPRALILMGERRVKEPRTPAQGRSGVFVNSLDAHAAERADRRRSASGLRVEQDAQRCKCGPDNERSRTTQRSDRLRQFTPDVLSFRG